MKSDRFPSLFFIAAVVFLTPLPSTEAGIQIDAWTTDNGLPQNSVTGLTQTPDGYIWFTTNEGLVRFDGVRFKVFNRSNTPEITNNRMLGAFADKSGKIWMSTEEGEILFYERGVFNIAKKPDDVPAGSPSRFFDDPSGSVIFYVSYRDYRGRNPSYKHFHYQGGEFVSLKIEGLSEESFLVLMDREGGLWFTDGKALRRFKDGKIEKIDLSAFSVGEINNVAYQDRQGSIWLGYTQGPKYFLLKIRDGRVESFPSPAALVSDFAEDSRGNLWVSLFNQGVYRIDQKSVIGDGPVTNLLEPVLLLDRIPFISHGFLFPDREGGIWVGTNQGLVRVTPQNIRVFSKQEGLPEENVYPVYEDSAGRIWAGIWQNSLVRYEGGSFKTFLRTKDTFYITSLFEDRGGRFWIGTSSHLYHLDKGRLVRFTEQAGFSGLTEFSVISEDRDNYLWFGTNLGLSRYSGGQATVFTKKDGLPDDYIIAFLQTGDGKIWVGTRGGLASIENGNIRAFTTADGLASNYIRSLYEDSDGVLWIGSYDGGLTRFKDGRFTRFTMKEGLSSDGVFCILEDHRGWFWMNSNQGIYRVRKQELNDFADGKIQSLNSIAYNKQDGLLSTEGNGGRQPAGVKARDGKLWFPTAQGIAVVDPETVLTNQLPPPVLIEEIVIDRNPVANEKLQSAIQGRSEIVLAPDQSNLEIGYTGISFINSGQMKFRYKLEGLDEDWHDVGTRRTAYYSYLPPGEYTFRVIAANRDGVWNTVGAFVKVRALPPFYRTSWFILLCLAALGCLAWAAYRWRVHQLRRQARKLRDVIETIPAMAWTALPDGSADFANRHWQEYTGLSAGETAGSRWQSVVHPEDLERFAGRWRASLDTGQPFESEVRFRRADGEYRWFLVRAVPLRDARGKVLKWYGTSTDIEERKRAEEERERVRCLQAELAHIDRVNMLGELTSSIAHEVNQPLAAIVTNANAALRWLAGQPPNLDEARETVGRIVRDGHRASEVIARVRALFKKTGPAKARLDMNDLIQDSVALVNSELRRNRVVLRTELAHDLPSASGDRVQLQQVVLNLIINGIEAMKPVTDRPRELLVRTQRDESGGVIVSVRDSGVGLEPQDTDRLFDAFYTTKAEGMGMGLSVSRSIIEAHGGRLWAESDGRAGATFQFTLPADGGERHG